MAYTREVLTLAVELGDAMLQSGAEIYRVEDCVTHILQAYDIRQYDVYVLSNGIFASANEDSEDACSMVRHVPLGAMHLGRIAALNQLARDICVQECSLTDAWERLDQCKDIKQYPKPFQLLFCGLGCGCFCYLFGGGIVDMLCGFAIGVLEQAFLFFCEKHQMSRSVKCVFSSMLVAVLSIAVSLTGLPVLYDKIIIGAIMPLVPGIVFTTAIRDFYNEDYLSGTIHLIDALLTALCIAVGVCLPILLLRYMGGVI